MITNPKLDELNKAVFANIIGTIETLQSQYPIFNGVLTEAQIKLYADKRVHKYFLIEGQQTKSLLTEIQLGDYNYSHHMSKAETMARSLNFSDIKAYLNALSLNKYIDAQVKGILNILEYSYPNRTGPLSSYENYMLDWREYSTMMDTTCNIALRHLDRIEAYDNLKNKLYGQ
jgi:hypothetical protein